jgi:hypothetical protein
MVKCVNEKCKKDPTNSLDMVVSNVDGDMACNTKCLVEYEHQRNTFFDNIGNDAWYNDWING